MLWTGIMMGVAVAASLAPAQVWDDQCQRNCERQHRECFGNDTPEWPETTCTIELYRCSAECARIRKAAVAEDGEQRRSASSSCWEWAEWEHGTPGPFVDSRSCRDENEHLYGLCLRCCSGFGGDSCEPDCDEGYYDYQEYRDGHSEQERQALLHPCTTPIREPDPGHFQSCCDCHERWERARMSCWGWCYDGGCDEGCYDRCDMIVDQMSTLCIFFDACDGWGICRFAGGDFADVEFDLGQ